MRSPARMVSGFEALVGRSAGNRKYFSFPLSSVICRLAGNLVWKAFAVALSSRVAVNVASPALIWIFTVFRFPMLLPRVDAVPGSAAEQGARAAAAIAASVPNATSFWRMIDRLRGGFFMMPLDDPLKC